MDKLVDVKIAGMGKVNGGKFGKVEISGMGEMSGDVDAESINISGMGKIDGSAKAKEIVIKGAGTIEGIIESVSLKASGTFTAGSNVMSGKIELNGNGSFKGTIKTKEIESKGYLHVKEGVEAEEFVSKGGFNIGGLLNANKMEIRVYGPCIAKEIGGEEILVKHSRVIDLDLIYNIIGKKERLQSDLIEGNNIQIEYTEAAVIRGKNIKIGPKCKIDLIEYSDTLDIDADSVVNRQVKI